MGETHDHLDTEKAFDKIQHFHDKNKENKE